MRVARAFARDFMTALAGRTNASLLTLGPGAPRPWLYDFWISLAGRVPVHEDAARTVAGEDSNSIGRAAPVEGEPSAGKAEARKARDQDETSEARRATDPEDASGDRWSAFGSSLKGEDPGWAGSESPHSIGPSTPDNVRRAGYLARRLHQAYNAAWARQVDPVLTSSQYAVLAAVGAHSSLGQRYLADVLVLDRSTMADVCRRLEDRRLINRIAASDKGRQKFLQLSGEGRVVLDQLAPRVRTLEKELMGQDSSEEEQLFDRLDELARRWESAAVAGLSVRATPDDSKSSNPTIP